MAEQNLDRMLENKNVPSQEQLISFIKGLGESNDGLPSDIDALGIHRVEAVFKNPDFVGDNLGSRISIICELGLDKTMNPKSDRKGSFERFIGMVGVVTENGGKLESFSAVDSMQGSKDFNYLDIKPNSVFLSYERVMDVDESIKKRVSEGKNVDRLVEKLKDGCCGKGNVEIEDYDENDDVEDGVDYGTHLRTVKIKYE